MNNSNEGVDDIFWLVTICNSIFKNSLKPAQGQVMELLRNASWNDWNSATSYDLIHQQEIIKNLLLMMNINTTELTCEIQDQHLPVLAFIPEYGWCVIFGINQDGHWLIETKKERLCLVKLPESNLFLQMIEGSALGNSNKESAANLFTRVFSKYKMLFIYTAIAAFFGNILALAGSLYSMQVYDRVLPSHNGSTLFVLMIGALIAAFIEFAIKIARHGITEYAIKAMDVTLSNRIYERMLRIRMDQFPVSLGTLSSQIRGYETVRLFMSSSLLFFTIDLPFSILFLLVITFIAGPFMAMVPIAFAFISLLGGVYYRKKISTHALSGNEYSNQRQGVLVETIQNAESIKATGMREIYSTRWNTIEKNSIENNMKVRHFSENANYFATFIQQVSYISLVSIGAWISISQSNLTSGALVACSILSGRVLSPVTMIPGLIVQWAHSKAALKGLEDVYKLELDNHGVSQPLTPNKINGEYDLENVVFSWEDGREALRLNSLKIRAGERVAILGTVGSGKSTLLKLLAGLYKSSEGSVLLDNKDIQQISRATLSEKIGYLAQESRLMTGSIRDNLLAGKVNIREDELLDKCQLTGLGKLLSANPRGLDLNVSENGSGMSGGQRQLVSLTSLLLRNPDVWLLDEPTSAMDDITENNCLISIQKTIKETNTLVLVTHKPALLKLVDRVIVIGSKGILADGHKDSILRPRNEQNKISDKISSPTEIAK
ncbi:TPA: ATP-binding cassette domain-containing protein [Enterobacter asburiae]|uniref:ATP-binding cassette domain-containing protein n=1 Tax=Enterobacter asburiae TaxID=61645 RepID=UPI0010B228C2|nr:ATP-binding cassette domain-containing protein [Enterobacter asburiae]BEK81560.1 ATP-binding cassette domain-containing protein [Enterobacter asburiae]HEC5301816.1 ATP-binding cassette domain-containing protein [Enterobacter asburiae]